MKPILSTRRYWYLSYFGGKTGSSSDCIANSGWAWIVQLPARLILAIFTCCRQTLFLITGFTWVSLSQFSIYVALPMVSENINGGARWVQYLCYTYSTQGLQGSDWDSYWWALYGSGDLWGLSHEKIFQIRKGFTRKLAEFSNKWLPPPNRWIIILMPLDKFCRIWVV